MNDDIIRRWVYLEESDKNPHYTINTEIEIVKINKSSVDYRVEYISKIQPNRWRNWYSKTLHINERDILREMRDRRIDEILD
jgi:hypothetical protein